MWSCVLCAGGWPELFWAGGYLWWYLGAKRGVVAGALGGSLGCIGFLIAMKHLGSSAPLVVGPLLGIGFLGATLGLAVIIVETCFRAASLEILWAPKEATSVTLGPKPVYLGGGDDHIYVRGLPEHAAGVVLEEGKVQYIDQKTSKKTELRDGSKIKIGQIEVMVKAKSNL
jgi:hypothetical protein